MLLWMAKSKLREFIIANKQTDQSKVWGCPCPISLSLPGQICSSTKSGYGLTATKKTAHQRDGGRSHQTKEKIIIIGLWRKVEVRWNFNEIEFDRLKGTQSCMKSGSTSALDCKADGVVSMETTKLNGEWCVQKPLLWSSIPGLEIKAASLPEWFGFCKQDCRSSFSRVSFQTANFLTVYDFREQSFSVN